MAKQMTIVFKVSDNIKPKLIKFYADKVRLNTPPYAIFQANDADTIITLYQSGKVMFQGISADIDAGIWMDLEAKFNNRNIRAEIKDKDNKSKDKDNKNDKENNQTFFTISTIGSDEVGTGDYFGPVVVTASFVSKENIPYVTDLGVKDSKKLTDEKICEIAPSLIKNIPYVTIILNNEDYNKFQQQGYNMNQIKAILHNKALVNLIKKDTYNYEKIVIDQFVYPKKYFEHIKSAKDIVKNITFVTKGEDKCLSVAVSSVISRYTFLIKMKELSDTYKTILPKGASSEVDTVAKKFFDKDGINTLNKIAKLNFKNTEKIKDL